MMVDSGTINLPSIESQEELREVASVLDEYFVFTDSPAVGVSEYCFLMKTECRPRTYFVPFFYFCRLEIEGMYITIDDQPVQEKQIGSYTEEGIAIATDLFTIIVNETLENYRNRNIQKDEFITKPFSD